MIENPILKGFCPDPSIIRVHNDYYIATSTFEWWPGVKIHHSKELRHWEQIASPIRRRSQLDMVGVPNSGGVWAPDLSYDGEKFYLVYTNVTTKKGRFYNTHNYLIETSDIYGEWSEPIYLNSTGFDPALFHDTDGKKYLINMYNGFKGILVQEYDAMNKSLIGSPKNIFLGTELGYTEGPHIYHVGEWYYLLVAEGGTGYEHCVTMARSKSIWGPYEVDPKNPMLTSKLDKESYLQKCGHADLVETQNGEWYLAHLCARPLKNEQACILGRETALQKVYWDSEGWLRIKNNEGSPSRYVEEPIGIETHCFSKEGELFDNFNEESLGIQYVSPRVPLDSHVDLKSKKGFLRLYGQESLNSLHHVSLVAVKQEKFQTVVETKMIFEANYPEQLAGLVYMYDSMNFYILGKTVNEEGQPLIVLIQSNRGEIQDLGRIILSKEDVEIYLQIQTDSDGKHVTFNYSHDKEQWINIGDAQSTSILTDEYCKGFTGAHFGMYCHDMTGMKKYADFDYFRVG